MQQSHISRGRAFVIMALVAVAALYGVVLALLGMV
jgi:F0F1-type ATP synthase membrane subunit c/vacuolar-type H+-ATPase subunit K